jgi:hypothetical protein
MFDFKVKRMDIADYYSMGNGHARRGEWPAARSNYEQVLRLQPGHAAVAASLLEVLLIQRDLAAATRLITTFDESNLDAISRYTTLYLFFKACTFFLTGSEAAGRQQGDELLHRVDLVSCLDWEFGPLNSILNTSLTPHLFQHVMGVETHVRQVQHVQHTVMGRVQDAGPAGVDDENDNESGDDGEGDDDGDEGDAKFTINEHLTLCMERGETNIYVDGDIFDQCKYLLLNKHPDVEDQHLVVEDKTTTMDEALWKHYGKLEDPGYHDVYIPARAAFWGHCSSLQAWAESGYDSSLLHANLAFPLLRALSRAGDPAAKQSLEREVITRWASEFEPVQSYLVEMEFLNDISAKGLVEIIKHDKVLDQVDWLLEKFDLDAMLGMWRAGDDRVQELIAEYLSGEIPGMEPSKQVILLARCKSATMAEHLLELIDVDAFPRELMTRARRNVHVKRLVPAIAREAMQSIPAA